MRLHEIKAYEVLTDPLYKQYKAAIDFAVSKYVNEKSAIYKGGSEQYSGNALFIRDPMSFPTPRTSRNTLNYYTAWVDNSAKWANFPKRSRSLICSSNLQTASGYGGVCVVVPTTDTAIGICPDDDWWTSFISLNELHADANEINHFIHAALRSNDIFFNGRTVSFDKFAKHLPTLDLNKIESNRLTDPLKNKAIALGGIVQLLDSIFDPRANGFLLTTWSKYLMQGNRELWLNAPCVMVPIELWKQLIAKGSNHE